MIQKFNQYNESLRDRMTGKSDEELKQSTDDLIKEIKEDTDKKLKVYDILTKIRSLKGIETDMELIDLLDTHHLFHTFHLIEYIIETLEDEYYQEEETAQLLIDLSKDNNN